MDEKDTIVIDIVAQNTQAMNAIVQLNKAVNNFQQKMASTNFNNYGQKVANSFGDKFDYSSIVNGYKEIGVQSEMLKDTMNTNYIKNFDNSFFGTIDKEKKEFQELGKSIVNRYKEQSAAATKAFSEQREAQSKMTRNTLQAGLGFMFAGMQLKRMFDTIKSDAFNTFNKLTANTIMANNSMNRLNMSMDYLKFTIGSALNDALEPMMPMLTGIIETIGDWIDKNPELAGGIIIWGGILAGAIMILGQLGTAFLAVKSAIALFGGAATTGAISGVGAAASTAASEVGGLTTKMNLIPNIISAVIGVGLTWAGLSGIESTDTSGLTLPEALKTNLLHILEVAAGAALVGFSVGGPIGAAIGFAVGAIVAATETAIKNKFNESDVIRTALGIDSLDNHYDAHGNLITKSKDKTTGGITTSSIDLEAPQRSLIRQISDIFNPATWIISFGNSVKESMKNTKQAFANQQASYNTTSIAGTPWKTSINSYDPTSEIGMLSETFKKNNASLTTNINTNIPLLKTSQDQVFILLDTQKKITSDANVNFTPLADKTDKGIIPTATNNLDKLGTCFGDACTVITNKTNELKKLSSIENYNSNMSRIVKSS